MSLEAQLRRQAQALVRAAPLRAIASAQTFDTRRSMSAGQAGQRTSPASPAPQSGFPSWPGAANCLEANVASFIQATPRMLASREPSKRSCRFRSPARPSSAERVAGHDGWHQACWRESSLMKWGVRARPRRCVCCVCHRASPAWPWRAVPCCVMGADPGQRFLPPNEWGRCRRFFRTVQPEFPRAKT